MQFFFSIGIGMGMLDSFCDVVAEVDVGVGCLFFCVFSGGRHDFLLYLIAVVYLEKRKSWA